MNYSVEEPVLLKKNISVTVAADDIDKAIDATVLHYRTSVSVPGFRKGKVPPKMVEKQYQQSIYMETTAKLLDEQIGAIIEELGLEPVTRMEYDAQSGIERGKDFGYSFSFFFAPEFELPEYAGFEVEQEMPLVTEEEVDAVLENLRNEMAQPMPVEEPRLPQAGDVAIIDFEGLEDGVPVPGMKAENMQVSVGDGRALEEFEKILLTIPMGSEGEDKVTFKDDFPDPKLAGKTLTIKIKVNALMGRLLPELDDDFARNMGGQFENMAMMREAIKANFMKRKGDACRENAQTKLLDSLLKMVEFSVPEGMIDRYTDFIANDVKERMQQSGHTFESMGRTEEQLKEDSRSEAENFCRRQIFNIRVARKEGIKVSDEDVNRYIMMIARQTNQDYEALRSEYENKNLIMAIRDRMISDRAMNFMYGKANVKFVPAPGAESKGEKAEAGAEAAPAEQAE